MLQNFLQSTKKCLSLYTDDNKLKYPSNPPDILKYAKKVNKNPTPRKLPQLLLLNFLVKLLTERKYLMNILVFVRRKYL